MNVTAKSNIQHDGQLYGAGQTLEVNEKQAADLLAAGVIEPVKGIKPTAPEEAPDRSIDTPDDVKAINENTDEVANLPIKAVGMKKTVLIGIARANGLEVEKTATASEVYSMIRDYREKHNIVIGNTEKVEEVKEAPAGTDEVATGAEAPVSPEVEVENETPAEPSK